MTNGTGEGGRQTALITGASGGIGLELARCFAAGGYDLVLVARSADRLEELAAELRRQGAGVRVLAKDLSLPASPEEVCRELAAAGATVDVLVNNAGFATFGPFAETPSTGSWRSCSSTSSPSPTSPRSSFPPCSPAGGGEC